MSINNVILELSQQISHLKSQYDALEVENKKLRSSANTKINRNIRSKNSNSPNIHFLKSVEAIKEKRLKELESKYSEDLVFIRKRYPRWRPNI